MKLEQNYRSTQTILDAAHAVVSRNEGRKDKKLWTDRGAGTAITLFDAYNEYEEAEFVAQVVKVILFVHGGAGYPQHVQACVSHLLERGAAILCG